MKLHKYTLEQLKKSVESSNSINGLKDKVCEMCGIRDWNGRELVFELHHIDGNRNNNSLDNLMILCPNCHSQTDNFRNKSRK